MKTAIGPDKSGPDKSGSGATGSDQSAATSWLPGFLLLAVIWGASFLFIKVGIRELHPVYVTLGRAVSGALALLAVLLVARHRLPREPRVWGHLAVVAAVGVVLPFTLFGYGEQRIPSMLAGIWNATTPLIVLPMAVLVFRTEKMTARRAVGMGLGFLGVLVVLGAWQGVSGAGFTGQLMCLGAALCYGLAIPYQKKFIAGRGESGIALATGQLLMATAQLAVLAPLVAGAPPAPQRLSLDVIGSVLLLGAFGTGLAFVINLRNIRLAGASTASAVTYLIPIVAVLVGVLALDERLAWYQPVGAVIVLAGVAVSQAGGARSRGRNHGSDRPVADPPAGADPGPPVMERASGSTPAADQPARC